MRKKFQFKNLNGKNERPLGRTKHRWNDDIYEIGYEEVDWFYLALESVYWRALLNMKTDILVP
jgi:hypothetical protein